MKTNNVLHVLTVVVGAILLQWFYPSVANCASPDLASGNSTNIQIPSIHTNTVNETGNLYRTIVEESSGKHAVSDSNKEVVTLKDKTDKVIWSINIAERLKAETNPRLRGRKIEGIQVYKGDLWVSVGRGYAVIDIKTGELKGIASN